MILPQQQYLLQSDDILNIHFIIMKFLNTNQQTLMDLNKSKKNFLPFIAFSVSSLAIVMVIIFFITKGVFPSISELSFTEHSNLGSDAGSVVPASCESGYGHFPNECDPFINLYFQ